MKKLSPSILNADFYCLEKTLSVLKKFGIKYLHMDVMDGHYVNNISFAFPVIESLYDKGFRLDIHLMIEEPEKYIERFAELGEIVTIHPKTVKNMEKIFEAINKYSKKLGFALNPDETIDLIEPYLNNLDLILLMSVFPGYGGQKFIPKVLKKAQKLQEIKKRNDFMLEIDGGINIHNLSNILKYDFDLIVIGSAIMKGNVEENLKNIGRFL